MMRRIQNFSWSQPGNYEIELAGKSYFVASDEPNARASLARWASERTAPVPLTLVRVTGETRWIVATA